MMPKVRINSLVTFSRQAYTDAANSFCSRQAYTDAANRVGVQPVIRKVCGSGSGNGVKTGEKVEVFWMRDPKSGNWIPENHFDDDDDMKDAVQLRDKFLPKKL